MTTRGADELSGLLAVVTRPAARAERLCADIERAGGRALRFPTVEVLGLALPGDDPRVARLGRDDLLVFVSVSAVEHGLPVLVAGCPEHRRPVVAAVGGGTAAALERAGWEVTVRPESDFSSEGLLAHPALQALRGRNVLIVRGVGGREELARELRSRGAEVDYLEVYRRGRPPIDPGPLQQALASGTVSVVVATSREGLRNLFAMMESPYQGHLKETAFVVISAALLPTLEQLGVTGEAVTAPTASDDGLFDALRDWWASTKPRHSV